MNIAPLGREATLDDLLRVEGKAELVDGRIVRMSPVGDDHAAATVNIVFSLKTYQREHGGGRVYGDNAGFIVRHPRVRSFSPDAAWWVGPRAGAKLFEGMPVFAVEVRSPEQYGPAFERDFAARLADYFAAGTRVVWDVDVLREGVIRVYRADDPQAPTLYHRGQIAEAEPAVPGWRFPVDELFD